MAKRNYRQPQSDVGFGASMPQGMMDALSVPAPGKAYNQPAPNIGAAPGGVSDPVMGAPTIPTGPANMGNPALDGVGGMQVPGDPSTMMGFADGGVVPQLNPYLQWQLENTVHPSIRDKVRSDAESVVMQNPRLGPHLKHVGPLLNAGPQIDLGVDYPVDPATRGQGFGNTSLHKYRPLDIAMRHQLGYDAYDGMPYDVNPQVMTQLPPGMEQAITQQPMPQMRGYADGGEVLPPAMPQGQAMSNIDPGIAASLPEDQQKLLQVMEQNQLTPEQVQQGKQVGGTQAVDPNLVSQNVDNILKQDIPAVQAMKSQVYNMVSSGQMSGEDANMGEQMIMAALQNPQLYPQLRNYVIDSFGIDQTEIPQNYDAGFLTVMLLICKMGKQMLGGGQPMPQGQQEMQSFADGGYVSPLPGGSGQYPNPTSIGPQGEPLQRNFAEGGYVRENDPWWDAYESEYNSRTAGTDQLQSGTDAALDSFGKRIHGINVFSRDEIQNAVNNARNSIYTDNKGRTLVRNQNTLDNGIALANYANRYLSDPIDLSWYTPSSYQVTKREHYTDPETGDERTSISYNPYKYSGYDAGYRYGDVSRSLNNVALGWTGSDDIVRGYMAMTNSQNIPMITAGYTKGDSKKQAKHIPVIQNQWKALSSNAANSYDDFMSTPVALGAPTRYIIDGTNALDYHTNAVDRRGAQSAAVPQRAGLPTVTPGDMAADGGKVFGPGTGTSDSIPIRVSAGEYVIPAHVVRAKGTDYFDKMLERYSDKGQANSDSK